MIKIKKSTLIVLIILAVLCGMAGFYSLQATGLLGRMGVETQHTLSDAQYREYKHLSSTYGKLDELRSDILRRYYIEVDEDKLETGMLKGLYDGLEDPYS